MECGCRWNEPSTLLATVLQQRISTGSPEDDVILADKWETELEQLLDSSAGIYHGWNLDSMIRAEFSKTKK